MERDAEDRRVRRIAKANKATGVWLSLKMLSEWTVCFTFCSVEIAIHPFKCCTVCVTAALKDKGNEAYAQEDYETAVKYYSDGLAELRDMQPLYTNRAQVSILILMLSFKCFTMKNTNCVLQEKKCNLISWVDPRFKAEVTNNSLSLRGNRSRAGFVSLWHNEVTFGQRGLKATWGLPAIHFNFNLITATGN